MARTRGSWNAIYAVAAVLVGTVVSFGGSFDVFSPFVSSSFKARQRHCRSSISTRSGYGGVKLTRLTSGDGASDTAQAKPPGCRPAPPPRELVEREKERWGSGTARVIERGDADVKQKKPTMANITANTTAKAKGRPAGREGRGGGSGKRRGVDRGAGPQILRWRMFNVEIPISLDAGKDDWRVSDALLTIVSDKLGIVGAEDMLTRTDMVIVRKSFDARTKKGTQQVEPRFSYTVDVRLEKKLARKLRLRTKEGKLEPTPPGGPPFPVSTSPDISLRTGVPIVATPVGEEMPYTASLGTSVENDDSGMLVGEDGEEEEKEEEEEVRSVSFIGSLSSSSSSSSPSAWPDGDNSWSAGADASRATSSEKASPRSPKFSSTSLEISSGSSEVSSWSPTKGAQPRVVVVGAGPAGLFAALELVQAGVKPIIVERGMPVERRGRSIGALFSRGILDPESNLCYGEGGAGTWSDGKLTTRIGRNSENVRKVLETLVAHGAPERILVDGKPHLGTDRLVRILRDLRAYLTEQGATFRFDTRVEGFLTRGGGERESIRGLKLAGGGELLADRVILAVGHSSRKVYERLLEAGVGLEAKGIAVGFRIEHPQAMIDELRYGEEVAAMVNRGKGKVPVADYRLTQSLPPTDNALPVKERGGNGGAKGVVQDRSCYSFCMCPGGQVVPTSVDPREVCVNGMSFSKRDSKWANAALVVSLTPEDVAADISFMEGTDEGNSPLRGVRWQSTMERRAADMGGGNLVVPVQRVTDYITGSAGHDAGLPTSSYRLGVRNGPLHEIYPTYVTEGLRQALEAFDKRMPGFVTDQALLHGVETRTSAPVQIARDPSTLESSMEGLYPAGEGAGFAGGIVSAAVDGIRVGASVAAQVLARPV